MTIEEFSKLSAGDEIIYENERYEIKWIEPDGAVMCYDCDSFFCYSKIIKYN